MTVEEIRKEALKHGYTLVKKKFVRKRKCSWCGEPGDSWVVWGKHIIKCTNCMRESGYFDTEEEAWDDWDRKNSFYITENDVIPDSEKRCADGV